MGETDEERRKTGKQHLSPASRKLKAVDSFPFIIREPQGSEPQTADREQRRQTSFPGPTGLLH